MASFRAIKVACEAVLKLLSRNYRPEDFNHELQFEVYLADNFDQPMIAGVSLFLYRVFPNNSHRIPGGRLDPEGKRYRTQLPLDLHFLLTAWGKDASLQHTIAGWMMRVLEDTPILPAGFLNALDPQVFRPDETLEITLAELSNEEMLNIWRELTEHNFQLSIPYVARNLRIESDRLVKVGEPLQERTFEYARPV
jgi:hypothetical protein